ncbi:MAG: hypothetical protein ACHQUC_02440, partial [Chlamydiales bacterium]
IKQIIMVKLSMQSNRFCGSDSQPFPTQRYSQADRALHKGILRRQRPDTTLSFSVTFVEGTKSEPMKSTRGEYQRSDTCYFDRSVPKIDLTEVNKVWQANISAENGEPLAKKPVCRVLFPEEKRAFEERFHSNPLVGFAKIALHRRKDGEDFQLACMLSMHHSTSQSAQPLPLFDDFLSQSASADVRGPSKRGRRSALTDRYRPPKRQEVPYNHNDQSPIHSPLEIDFG